MSGPIVRSGPSVKFTDNWAQAFAGGKPAKKTAAKPAKASGKGAAKGKAKAAAKPKKKATRKKA